MLRFVITYSIFLSLLNNPCFAKEIPHIKSDINSYKVKPRNQEIKIYGLNRQVYDIISHGKKIKDN